jgi:XisH protein
MAKDLFHDAVRNALEKEGWTITDDPMNFKVGAIKFGIDLAAEKVLVAEKENEKIAVEIKTFSRQSPLNAFHEALGQYENYLIALDVYEPERILFLAIPINTYKTFFQKPFIQMVLQRKKIRLIIYNPSNETIASWIK